LEEEEEEAEPFPIVELGRESIGSSSIVERISRQLKV
jgi:hypothetical protein